MRVAKSVDIGLRELGVRDFRRNFYWRLIRVIGHIRRMKTLVSPLKSIPDMVSTVPHWIPIEMAPAARWVTLIVSVFMPILSEIGSVILLARIPVIVTLRINKWDARNPHVVCACAVAAVTDHDHDISSYCCF